MKAIQLNANDFISNVLTTFYYAVLGIGYGVLAIVCWEDYIVYIFGYNCCIRKQALLKGVC